MEKLSKEELTRRAAKAAKMREQMLSQRYVARLVRHVREADGSAPQYPYYGSGEFSKRWPYELYLQPTNKVNN